ncbi:MAG: Gfo/Idh/MocA family oxidoreductase [Chloroflexota bacterium]
MTKKQIRFGIIGLGLMGREFASAAARWLHLLDLDFVPVITGICDKNEALFDWYTSNIDTITVKTTDYNDLLNSDHVDAIYCAVPHNLHQQFYIDIITSGKALLGEKPFGMDVAQNTSIMQTIAANPDVFVACSSEFPFFPGAQRVIQAIRENEFGQIIDVEAGFLHSSDINPDKTINWKRMVDINGRYGCMGDLGLHVFHVPLRFGWQPKNVRALLSNIMTERYNADGDLVPCETWDNATLVCEVESADHGNFPMTLKTYRIAPGETNTWYININGTRKSVRFSTRQPKSFYTMDYEPGGKQVWAEESLGYDTAYKTITGGIFEFGFSDSLLQMWAAFCDEMVNGRDGMRQPFYCATPDEAAAHHRVLTAALESEKQAAVIGV